MFDVEEEDYTIVFNLFDLGIVVRHLAVQVPDLSAIIPGTFPKPCIVLISAQSNTISPARAEDLLVNHIHVFIRQRISFIVRQHGVLPKCISRRL
jgi:hypothetical protein